MTLDQTNLLANINIGWLEIIIIAALAIAALAALAIVFFVYVLNHTPRKPHPPKHLDLPIEDTDPNTTT